MNQQWKRVSYEKCRERNLPSWEDKKKGTHSCGTIPIESGCPHGNYFPSPLPSFWYKAEYKSKRTSLWIPNNSLLTSQAHSITWSLLLPKHPQVLSGQHHNSHGHGNTCRLLCNLPHACPGMLCTYPLPLKKAEKQRWCKLERVTAEIVQYHFSQGLKGSRSRNRARHSTAPHQSLHRAVPTESTCGGWSRPLSSSRNQQGLWGGAVDFSALRAAPLTAVTCAWRGGCWGKGPW